MAMKVTDIEEYVFESPRDDGEPKTKYILTPIKKMEQFRVSSIISRMFDDEDDKIPEDFVTITEDAERIIYAYLAEHLVRVENIYIENKLVKSIDGSEIIERIGGTDALEIVSNAVSRATVKLETAKN